MTPQEASEELKEEFEIFKNCINKADWENPDEELRKIIEANSMAIEILGKQPCEDCIRELICEDCIRELIREFDNKHPALFADYMQEFNNHPISEIIEYIWDMHDLIEDIKYRLPSEGGDEE